MVLLCYRPEFDTPMYVARGATLVRDRWGTWLEGHIENVTLDGRPAPRPSFRWLPVDGLVLVPW